MPSPMPRVPIPAFRPAGVTGAVLLWLLAVGARAQPVQGMVDEKAAARRFLPVGVQAKARQAVGVAALPLLAVRAEVQAAEGGLRALLRL